MEGIHVGLWKSGHSKWTTFGSVLTVTSLLGGPFSSLNLHFGPLDLSKNIQTFLFLTKNKCLSYLWKLSIYIPFSSFKILFLSCFCYYLHHITIASFFLIEKLKTWFLLFFLPIKFSTKSHHQLTTQNLFFF